MKEIWKDIEGYEGLYQISSMGRVKSLWFWKERILKECRDWRWYTHVLLTKNKIAKTYKPHRLVAIAFVPNPKNKKEINHKNWNGLDNRVENIEWATRSENEKHKYDVLWYVSHLKWKYWKNNSQSKKVWQYSKKDWVLIRVWDSMADIRRETWICNVCACCQWKLKSVWGYIWKYHLT